MLCRQKSTKFMVSAPLWNLFGIFLLQEHFVHSEVADVTGIVKYTRKRVFLHQPPPRTFFGKGGLRAPCPPSTPLPMRKSLHLWWKPALWNPVYKVQFSLGSSTVYIFYWINSGVSIPSIPGRIKVGRWNECVRAKRCDAVDWDSA